MTPADRRNGPNPPPRILRIRPFALLMLPVLLAGVLAARNAPQAEMASTAVFDLAQRAACQALIEDLRWSHRIWPEANPHPKPERWQVLGDEQIEARVEDSLRMVVLLREACGITIRDAMRQAELVRMARTIRRRKVLRTSVRKGEEILSC